MIIDFPETEACMRCGGKGHFFTKLGVPGQDVRDIGYANMEWQPTTGPHWCKVCDSTGRRTLRRRPQDGPRFVTIQPD